MSRARSTHAKPQLAVRWELALADGFRQTATIAKVSGKPAGLDADRVPVTDRKMLALERPRAFPVDRVRSPLYHGALDAARVVRAAPWTVGAEKHNGFT